MLGRFASIIVLLVFLTSCATTSSSSFDDPPFRVIAYVTGGIVPETIPYGRLTHINYSFLIPNEDGSLAPFANSWKLDKIVADAHAADVKVLIAVGGWGWDEEFETLAADPTARATFVKNISEFVEKHNLDGVDMDWEYPDPGDSSQNFLLLIQELRTALPDKLITTAVASYGYNGDGIASESFELFDFINVMTYDGADHGTMAQYESGLAYWQERGLPAEKIVMGIPFYARPSETTYRKLIESDPQAAQGDTMTWNGETITYNGIATVKTKTEMALEKAGGVMFWTLEHDAADEQYSLLKAIDEVVQNKP